MSLHQIKVFCSVVQHKSFSQAAASLHLSQPAVSMEVKALEKSLGLKLINRNYAKRSMTLTPEGKIIYEQALRVNKEVLELERKAEALKNSLDTAPHRLKIMTNTSLATYVIPVVLSTFQAENPDVQVAVTMTTSRQTLEPFQPDDYDLIFVSHDQALGLDVKFVFQERLVLVKKREELMPDPQHVDNLASIPLVVAPKSSPTRKTIDEFFDSCNLSPMIITEIAHAESIKRTAVLTNAYAILTYSSVREEIQKSQLSIVSTIPPLPSITYIAGTSPNVHLSQIAKDFLHAFSITWFHQSSY